MTIISSFKHLLIICYSLIVCACTSMQANISNRVLIPANASITVGPIANHSDTPLANRQVESITLGLLHAQGFKNVNIYPRTQSCEKLLYCPDEAISTDRLLALAKQTHATFILTGAANEWRYKVGLDGEPVAGVSLALLNVASGKTIWTGVGSIIGSSRSGLDIVGQKLLHTLLASYMAI